jgi:hypothetical protein
MISARALGDQDREASGGLPAAHVRESHGAINFFALKSERAADNGFPKFAPHFQPQAGYFGGFGAAELVQDSKEVSHSDAPGIDIGQRRLAVIMGEGKIDGAGIFKRGTGPLSARLAFRKRGGESGSFIKRPINFIGRPGRRSDITEEINPAAPSRHDPAIPAG